MSRRHEAFPNEPVADLAAAVTGPPPPPPRRYFSSRCWPAARGAGRPGVAVVEGDCEVLTYLDGDVAVDSHWQPGHGNRLPPYARTDRALRGAAELVRQLHGAAVGFQPVITSYRFHP